MNGKGEGYSVTHTLVSNPAAGISQYVPVVGKGWGIRWISGEC